MDVMTPLDAAFLDAEDADPNISMAIASISIFEGSCPQFADITALVNAALPHATRYRQVVRPVPLSLGMPRWVDDQTFDVGRHLRHTALPAPGGDAELGHLMSRLMVQRLSRDRPLWEVWLVEGLAEGRWAMINKVHHCMVDGIAGVGLLHGMLSETRQSTAQPSYDAWQPAAAPGDREVVLDAVRDLASEPVQWGRGAVRAARHPRSSGAQARDIGRGLLTLSAAAIPEHPSSILGSTGQARKYRWTRTTLSDIARIRAAFGGTMNDVVLSVIAGAFRSLLIWRGERCDPHSVRSLVPVSVRTQSTRGVLDNEVSAMLPYLPVEVPDPVRRLQVMQDRMCGLKASKEALAGDALVRLARSEPPPLVSLAVRMGFRLPQRSIGTVTTNVPGPAHPLYALGRQLLEIYPYVPIASTLRFGIALLTYCGTVTFGVTADFDSTSDIDVFLHGIDRAISDLAQAAESAADTSVAVLASG
jgi:WS/DGAT/MGAT family acyltransferase